MISNELLSEIIYLSNRGKFIDSKMIRRIVKDLISNTNKITMRRFKLVRFKNSNLFCAQANSKEGKLRVSLKLCYEDINSYKRATILEKNLHLLAIIIHEVLHLEEPYKVRLNNVEGKLIKLSDYQTSYFKDGDVNYDTYYTNPSEKIASALSYKKLLEILENYPGFIDKYPKVFLNINKEYLERLIYGYEKTNAGLYNVPLLDFTSSLDEQYLKELKIKLQTVRNKNKIRRMSSEEKLMYGLPITKRKIKQLERKYK